MQDAETSVYLIAQPAVKAFQLCTTWIPDWVDIAYTREQIFHKYGFLKQQSKRYLFVETCRVHSVQPRLFYTMF